MTADLGVEWTRDIGGGLLMMERIAAGYRAALVGFRGVGSTQEEALDDLLARMRDHQESSAEFARSIAPGGRSYELDRQLELAIDRLVQGKS